jgi:hypothetical protein
MIPLFHLHKIGARFRNEVGSFATYLDRNHGAKDSKLEILDEKGY